ncbi:MAG: hypothetical protein E7623_07055, partial [Ruminococcaceae bacterium]|nr:hypothetical protein [Oscillospiraceae bacterium]
NADSEAYKSPIKIGFNNFDEATQTAVTVVRCAEFDADGTLLTKTYTSTYILVKDEDRFSTPLISLVTDEKNLYSDETGIFIEGDNQNCFQTGRKSEREVHIDYIDSEGLFAFEQDGGMRLMGQGARRAFTHKTLRIFARKDYDDSGKFKYPFFENYYDANGDSIEKFDQLILRTGSSNTYNSILNSQFVYKFSQEIDELDTGNYAYATVFLNGKYYGFMAILENYDPDFFEGRYGILEEEVTALNGGYDYNKNTILWELDDGPESEYDEFINMLQFIAFSDMTDEKNYKKACEMLDIDNFIAYIALECYMENWDWPRNNIRVWRYNTNGYAPEEEGIYDGKWRFLLKDLDASFWMCNSDVDLNYFGSILRDFGALDVNYMFQSLYKNRDFKNRFLNFTCDMLSSSLEKNRLIEILNEMELSMCIELEYMLEHYLSDPAELTYVDSLEEWDQHINNMRRFILRREQVVWDSIYPENDNAGACNLRVVVTDGCDVTINTIEDVENGDALKYLKNIPIPYEINDIPGYEFESMKLTGGKINKGKTFTLTENNARLTIKYKKVSDVEAEDTEPSKEEFDERLHNAFLINGTLYEESFFTIKDGVYYVKSKQAREMLPKEDNVYRTILRAAKKYDGLVPILQAAEQGSGYCMFKVKSLNTTVITYTK